MSQVETVEEFLARGGQIQTIPRGAMAESGWTPAQMVRMAATGNTGQGAAQPPTRPEDVPITGVHRVPNRVTTKPPKAPKPPKPKPQPRPKREKPAKPERGPYANRNGADGAKTVALLEALAGGWCTSSQVAKATGQVPPTVCARLNQLRARGVVISHGQRPYTVWALTGAAPPSPRPQPPSEFDGLTDLQLLAKGNETREQIRAGHRLIVKIEREIKRRTLAARRSA